MKPRTTADPSQKISMNGSLNEKVFFSDSITMEDQGLGKAIFTPYYPIKGLRYT